MSLELEDSLDAALSFLDEFEPLVAARDEGSIDALDLAALMNDDGLGFSGLEELVQVNDEDEAKPAPAKSTQKKGRKRQPSAKPSASDPNRAREMRKKEIVYLRNKVVEMETQLEELKQAGDGSSGSATSVAAKSAARLLAARTGRPTVATLTRGGRIRASSRPQFVWEEIASRQYAERHKAELENVKLRMMLEGQIKVAKSLESVLKKRSTTQVSDLSGRLGCGCLRTNI